MAETIGFDRLGFGLGFDIEEATEPAETLLDPQPVVQSLVLPIPTLVLGAITISPTVLSVGVAPEVPTLTLGSPSQVPGLPGFDLGFDVLGFDATSGTEAAVGGIFLLPPSLPIRLTRPAPVVAAGFAATPGTAPITLSLPIPTIMMIAVQAPGFEAGFEVPGFEGTPTGLSGPLSMILDPIALAVALTIPIPGVRVFFSMGFDAGFETPGFELGAVSGTRFFDPTPVATTLLIASPTLSHLLSRAPTAVPLTLETAGVTVSFGVISRTPGALPISFDIPLATIMKGVLPIFPSADGLMLSIPAPVLAAGVSTRDPGAVPISLLFPAPGVELQGILAPGAVALTHVFPAPGAALTLAIQPTSTEVAITIPAPTLMLTLQITPGARATLLTFPQPTLTLGTFTVTPPAVPAALLVSIPIVNADPTAINIVTLPITLTLPASALAFGATTISPGILAVPVTLPAPTRTALLTLQSSAVPLSLSIPQTDLTFGATTLTPEALRVLMSMSNPAIIMEELTGYTFLWLPIYERRR